MVNTRSGGHARSGPELPFAQQTRGGERGVLFKSRLVILIVDFLPMTVPFS